jgi:hypothetical protein
MTGVLETIRKPVLHEPDAGFDELRAHALGVLQAAQRDERPHWTDHNLHDPGITLLEAALYGIADLHYRIEERSFAGWAFEPRPWRGLTPVRSADRQALADFFAVPGNAVIARAGFVRAASRSRAAVDLAGSTALRKPDATVLRLTPGAAAAAVGILREPQLRRALLDRTGPLEAAIAGAASTAGARTIAARLVEDLELWPEEIDALIAAVARRRLVRLLRERGDELRALVDAAATAAAAILALQGPFAENDQPPLTLTAAEAQLALGQHSCPPVDPEQWEDADGATRLWPPSPVQARTCDPVTADDYRRLALAIPTVQRAWLVKGVGRGIAWDGSIQSSPRPYRRGALTLVFEPATGTLKSYAAAVSTADQTALMTLMRAVLDGPTGNSELDPGAHQYPDYRTTFRDASPRRLLGDELCAGFLRTFPVVVRGVLEIVPTASGPLVLSTAEQLLRDFLSPRRISPLEPLPPAPVPLVCPQEIEGPWPRGTDVRAFLADPHGARVERGWRPGDPVRASELVQLLHEVPGVAGVAELDIQLDGEPAGSWHMELTAPGNDASFCVPTFQRHCLCVRLVEPLECRNA